MESGLGRVQGNRSACEDHGIMYCLGYCDSKQTVVPRPILDYMQLV
jgi:hypothetical protein